MEKIKIPKDMDDAKALGTVLSKYKDTYYTQVLVAYFATYVLYPWSKVADLSTSPFCLPLRLFSGFQRHCRWPTVFLCLWPLKSFHLFSHINFLYIYLFCTFLPWPFVASLQTFAIPGSIFLSILSGYLYPFPLALFLVCLVSRKRQDISLRADCSVNICSKDPFSCGWWNI